MKYTLVPLLLAMLAAFLLLENCSPFTRVYGEIEPGVNLSQFHTYKWLDNTTIKKGNQVWRGAAVGILENLKPEAADARIEAAVKAIFTKYPEKPIPTAIPATLQ